MARSKAEEALGNSLKETYERLRREGLLLVSALPRGRPNIMTIGWGLFGRFWADPYFMVAVRHSRYTHGLIEKSKEFTVNVPRRGMEKIVDFCGTVSGRDHDKFKEMGLTAMKAKRVSVPIISECSIHYECRVLFQTEVFPNRITKGVHYRWYRSEDYHTLYFGKVVSLYKSPGRGKRRQSK